METLQSLGNPVSYTQSNFSSDWDLVGSGDPHDWCGTFKMIGCLDFEAHKNSSIPDGINYQTKLSGEIKNLVYVEPVKRSCYRPACPICKDDWIIRESVRAGERVRSYKTRHKPIHVVVSVPGKDYSLDVQDMRKIVYKGLKAVSCYGGSMMYHPKRKKCARCGKSVKFMADFCRCGSCNFIKYYSPHFHIVGYGWISVKKVVEKYEETGYLIRNLGVRESLDGLYWYLLSHCGYKERKHTVTWFGSLSYTKLKVPKKEEDPKTCPLCNGKLSEVIWWDNSRSCQVPDIQGYGVLCDWYGWRYARDPGGSKDFNYYDY